jgi:hypothetical protein
VDELLIALVAAVFGLAGTVLGAVVAARATKVGADKNAETVRRQVADQAGAEHAHWLRQQRLNAYEGFLEARMSVFVSRGLRLILRMAVSPVRSH